MNIINRKFKVVGLALLLMISIFAVMAPYVAAVDWMKKDLGNVGGAVRAVATGDGNNDGNDEVYAASQNGGVYQLKQDKDKPKDWTVTTLGFGEGSNFQMLGIVTGDGRDNGKDAVYAGGGTSSGWTGKMYEFVKTDSGWQRIQMGTGGYYIFDVDLGDGDKDDRNEVYAASYDGRIYEYSYSTSWNAKDIGYTGYYQRGVGVGDGDNDGDTEVYSAGGWWNNKEAWQYEYNTSNSSWGWKSLGQPPNLQWWWLTDIDVGDGDGDGKNELYVTEYQYLYQIKYNAGSWTWTTIWTNPNQWNYHVDIGDGDGDGKSEVYVATGNDQIYKISYSGGNWGQESLGSGNGDMFGVDVGNGDNFPNQLEVYGGCQDSHVYQFFVDKQPPPNPKVWSPTHEPGVWSNNNNVEVAWRPPPDPSGIDGYSFVWDNTDDTIPAASKTVEETVTATESGPLADGDDYYFHIRARDNALNWNPGATHFGPLKIDTVAPTDINITINNDAQYTNNRLVTLNLGGTDGRSGMGTMAFSNDGTTWPDVDDWEPWNDTMNNWDLTDLNSGGNNNDGLKTVFMQARDKAGNIALSVANDSIFLDRAKPVGLSINIEDGAQYTNSADVILNLTASDPDPASGLSKMMFSNDGVNWSDWENWNYIRSGWSLISDAGGSDIDGTKIVYMKVKDRAGNVAGPMQDDIILDRNAPGSLSISINDGAAYTNKTDAKLNVSANDPSPGTGVERMQFSNDDSDWSSWEDFSNSKNPWSLTAGAGGTDVDGDKPVYFQVKDVVGNIGGPIKDTIFLDRAKPTNLKLTINGGASLTNKVDVSLTLAATDPDPASGLFQMQLKEGTGAWGSWETWSTTKTFTVTSGDGTKTVSFRVKDNAGNVAGPVSDSIILDTTAPTISNIKVIGITDTSAIVTWTTDSPANSTVYYGTDINYGNQKVDDTLVVDHSVTLIGLTPVTLYHFMVMSYDEVGNGPTKSTDHTFTTKETPDNTTPVLTNLRVEGITDNFAIILWDTNEPADSNVKYGETTTYDLVVGSSSNVQKHSVSLTGLKTDTEYFFMVQSTDASGNGPVEDKGKFRTMITPDTIPPVITNVQVSGLTDKIAVITWTTDEVADSIVEYGTSTNYGSVVNDPGFIRDHMLTLPNLSPATTYYFIVRSTDPSGNGPTTSSQYQFQTESTPDTIPPMISNVRASGITNTMAIISWNTDELSDSKVDFGTTTAYGQSADDLTFTLSHSVTLTGLTPSSTYHFKALSSDLSGNGPASSNDFTFTTTSIDDKEPPIIEWVKVEGIRSNVAVILWLTNEPADSIVEFGTDTNYGDIIRDEEFLLDHSILLRDLNTSTSYHFRVMSTDISGNGPTISNDYQFTTEAVEDTIPPVVSGVKMTNITNRSVTITWDTNEPGNTLIGYGKNLSIGSPIGESEDFYLSHKFELQDLEPGTEYSFIIYSDDPSGNRGTSQKFNFTTLEDTTPPEPPGPGPGPNPFFGNDNSWFWILGLLLIIAAAVVAVGLYVYSRRKATRKRPGVKGKTRDKVHEIEELDMEDDVEDMGTLDMEGEDLGTLDMEGDEDDIDSMDMDDDDEPDWGVDDVDEMESLDMEDDLGGEDIRLGSAITAVTSGATVGRPRPMVAKEPVRKVKCPGCKSAIPIYSETQTDIECPKCGKTGKIKPLKTTSRSTPTKAIGVSPLASVLGDDLVEPKKIERPGPAKRPPKAGAKPGSTQQPKSTPLKTLNCSGCKGKVPVYTTKRPVRITCPSCNKSGTLKR